MRNGLILVSSLFLVSTSAWAERIKIKTGEASSTYVAEDADYGVRKAFDGKQGTSWVEGEEGSGLGAWIKLDFGEEKEVVGLRVWGGDWYNSDAWQRANRPKELEILLDDGTKQTVKLEDEMKVQRFTLDKPGKSSSVRIRIKSTYSGSTWLDTGISEIQVFAKGGAKAIEPKSITASSELPADADGSYVAKNVADGVMDSMWCEADKEGDGTGQTLTFDFGAARKVSKLELINGMGTSLSLWMKANRATTAKLTFSDGSSVDVEIRNSMRAQTIEFAAHETTSVALEFTGVAKGKEYNDLCISEASFSE